MSVKLNDLHSLMVEELKDLYNAETQLVSALPKMEKAAHNKELKHAFAEHLEETKGHVKRLEDIFKKLQFKPTGTKCEAMEGLIKEGSDMIKADAPDDVKDAALIAAAQRVEHYEIAGYGSVRTFAEQMGHEDIMNLLQETLDEEGEADKKLSSLALQGINKAATAK